MRILWFGDTRARRDACGEDSPTKKLMHLAKLLITAIVADITDSSRRSFFFFFFLIMKFCFYIDQAF